MQVSIIGTAGRGESGERLNKNMYQSMYLACRAQLEAIDALQPLSEVEAVSGGAAWADHLAVSLFKAGVVGKLHLHLPTAWDYMKAEYIDTGERDFRSNPGGTCNYYHRRFSEKMGQDSLLSIHKLLEEGKATYSVHNGLHARNLYVAKSPYLIALTWGRANEPADGGTAHTWEHCKGERFHISLWDL